MQEWEYHVEFIDSYTKTNADAEAKLTALGICGWRLVAVQGDLYFFERPR